MQYQAAISENVNTPISAVFKMEVASSAIVDEMRGAGQGSQDSGFHQESRRRPRLMTDDSFSIAKRPRTSITEDD